MEEMKGIERIKQFSKETKDQNIKKVAEYLINREDMNDKFLNEEKNLTDMWEFIRDKAREKAINGCAVLEDQDVYNLAVHYFDETNEALGIKTTKKQTKPKEETKKQDAKTEENVSNTKQDAEMQDKKKSEDVPAHKDDDVVMVYKGKPVTYKEFKEGTYLQLS